MKKWQLTGLVMGIFLAALGVAAQNDGKRAWSAEDIIHAEQAGQFRVSPDGRWAVWVKSTADKEKDRRVSNLYLSSLLEKKEIQLTRGTESHSAPRWSPSGELIAFLSTRPRPGTKPDEAQTQLWLIHPFGGEPWHVTEFVRGIRSYQWVDADTILFSAEEDPTLYEQELKKKKDQTRVVEDHQHTPPVRLFRLAVKEKKVTRLTANDDWIQGWHASRDGRYAVALHGRHLAYQWDQKVPPVTVLHDFSSGEAKEILTELRDRPVAFRWARDGSGVYVAALRTNHPQFYNATITVLYFYDLGSGTADEVPLDWERGIADAGFEVTDDGFIALLADGVRFQLARYTRSAAGWTRTMLAGEHAGNIFDFALGEDGRALVYEHSTASKPAQWYRATLHTAEIVQASQLTSVNPGFEGKPTARSEVVRWKGALDEEVEGVLYYPHGYQPGRRYPLMLIIHGGPTGYDMDRWEEDYTNPQQMLTERGAFVLRANYHGSGNYGLAWAESICCGKYYELEVPDLEAGVDHLIERGLADPERVGTMGWSNGAILSIALSVANPERYKVVSAGAGDVEWISDWANVDFGHAFDAYYFGASPLENPQLYIEKSPLFKMDRVKAPTIIYFGTEDRAVPTSQGWTHYRALYHLGQAPVRFLLFPGEAHGIRKLTFQTRKLTEDLAWFDRYLFKSEQPRNLAVKEGSPLELAFRRQNIARAGGRYGVAQRIAGRRGELLVPETVPRGDIEIGRFEVTRAQYAEFDRTYRVEPGTENYPASGLSFEQAAAYADWLSRQTGQRYRLPRAAEVEELYKRREGENTLDYWAGYSPNPDDAARLAEKIAELGGDAPLLMEVGRFAPQGEEGEEPLFDLGGNVAEWVLGADGKGVAMGGSADRPADPKSPPQPAAAAYTGFRIVREK